MSEPEIDEAEWEREREEKRLLLLRQAWLGRDRLYRDLFGEPTWVSPKNYGPPSLEVKTDKKVTSGSMSVDPTNPYQSVSEDNVDSAEQHLAVLAYGPDPFRPHWTYITAGISSPWVHYEPQEVSGFGCELMIKSPVDLPWAPQVLRTMAFYIFNHAGTLSPGVRIGLGGPIQAGSDSALRNVIIYYADEAPDCWYQLPSGGFGIFLAIGVTEAECRYAESVEKYGTWCVEQLLRRKGYGQITDPTRRCTMDDADTPAMLSSIKQFADTFRENEADIMGENL
ncbi:MAG TPA: suppressor of fused domain protein [Candidatus Obscuribacter sp.]|nr:suppressor of fused domain protein [Candidatus Melainabacteria bacterium]MBK8220589.1 suppressor of fused domain protein [Candidatus Obscuribacter sp.]MBK9279176.1 suppressor of fused domain protein [Candidatus Obscuribacter sp.]MBL8082851.1 suppressor of fused domain protein [Candidatus Obscuribacter sp.]HMW89437.1 suppressor of fused domain protein [Candidatus Obscuribacter sp.]